MLAKFRFLIPTLFVTVFLAGCQTPAIEETPCEPMKEPKPTLSEQTVREVKPVSEDTHAVKKPVKAEKPKKSPSFPIDAETSFRYSDIQKFAQKLAERPYENSLSIPRELASLTYREWQKIHSKTDTLSVIDKKSRYGVIPLCAGALYDTPVRIHWITKNDVQEIELHPSDFTGCDIIESLTTDETLPLAGFSLQDRKTLTSLYTFLGATYFKGTVNGHYGSSALGLIVYNPELSLDFPRFTDFWILKPNDPTKNIKIYALMQSPLITGAYEFFFSTTDQTTVKITNTLFMRDKIPEKTIIGLYPVASMYFGDDIDPTDGKITHEADALLIEDKNEKHFVKITNPRTFMRLNYPLKGLQRFTFANRSASLKKNVPLFDPPQLTVTPFDPNDAGVFYLDLVPTTNTLNNNVYGFYCPDTPKLFSTKNPLEKAYSYKYQIDWSKKEPDDNVARIVFSDVKTDTAAETLTVTLRFAGGKLSAISPKTGLSTEINHSAKQFVTAKSLRKIDRRTWELVFTIRSPIEKSLVSSFLSRQAKPRGSERLTAYIKLGDNLPEPLTEIWTLDLMR